MLELKQIEEKMLEFWQKNNIYAKAKAAGAGKPWFNFIDGPPYPTGSIHVGTAWNKVMKDVILRFKRMRGFRVHDQPGYDMHGLPVEVKVEKELGITDKREIEEKIGIAKFVQACRDFSGKNMDTMSKQFARLGVWMDWPRPYKTTDDSYISSVWWAIKKTHENGLLYQGLKVVQVCPRCATALAKHELEYQNVKERSVYLKFKVKDESITKIPKAVKGATYLLVWTTTPWTLPGNTGVMANPDFDYLLLKVRLSKEGKSLPIDKEEPGSGVEYWVMLKALANAVMANLEYKYGIISEFKGSVLEGLQYVPLLEKEVPGQLKLKNGHRVVMSEEYVHSEGGTGFVHCAPGHGPEDFEVGKKTGLPVFCPVEYNGKFTADAGKYAGLVVKKDDQKIVDDLKKDGRLIGEVDVEHEYAHCWRCKSPIIFLSTKQWFIAVEKIKEKMLAENAKILWVPDWAGNAWFKSWLEGLQDWCISRQRYWGIPLPVWRCDKCGEMVVIGSKKELESYAKVPELHKPWVDEITWKCKCGGKMKRDPDIVDVWLDSAAATWASFGKNPLELRKEGRWPCDWIIEGKDQIRGWFYSQMGLSMVTTGIAPYRAVFMHGHIQDEHGRKMSKSLGNYISPDEVIEKYGSEPLRWYSIMGTSPGLDLSYGWGHTELAMRNLDVLFNVYKFAQRDLELANFKQKKFKPTRIGDIWVLSKLETVTKKVTEKLEKYELPEVPRILEDFFLNDLSRWYIKSIRERTWVSATGEDKETALQVLYMVLERLCRLLAPIIPLLSEYIYQEVLKKYVGAESVHLLAWPAAGKSDEKLEAKMKLAQQAIEASLSAREAGKVKLRHPLDDLVISEDVSGLEEIVAKMANVKNVTVDKNFKPTKDYQEALSQSVKVWLNIKPSEETEQEAAVRDLMRQVQVTRMKEKLSVEEKIVLFVDGDSKIINAVKKFEQMLTQKTGASEIVYGKGETAVDTALGQVKFGFRKT